MMIKNPKRIPGAAAATLVAAAALAPWAAAFGDGKPSKPTQGPQHRRTTDPPIASKGKLATELFMAVGQGDLKGVQSLLAQGADANARNGLEFVPLYLAAATHQEAMMNALLAGGAKPSAESPYGTPLSFAAITGNAEGARLLLSKGVDVNVTRVDGLTPLMLAANAGNPEAVKVLLDAKAKVNDTNNSEASALTFAARSGHVAAGELLIKGGAKIDQANVEGETPLMMAAKSGHADFAKLLIQRGAKVNLRDKKGRTALALAAAYGDHPDVVKTLLDAGADRKLADAKGRTPAALASARGYEASAGLLGKPAAAAPRAANAAIEKSVKLLEFSMSEFSRKTACISCHQEGLGRMVTASAREKGFATDPELNKAQLGRIRGALGAMKPLHQAALKDPAAMKQVPLIEMNEVTTGDGWLLGGMAAQGDTPTEATAAMAMVLGRLQMPDGSWTFALPRVPMQSSFFTFTALAIRSLNAYGPKSNAEEIADRIGKAKGWLLKAPAKTSDDMSFRLLGLKWAGATDEERKAAIEELKAAQRPDGGWAQVPGMDSDAYGTGQAIYALRVGGGLDAQDPAVQKGAKFLLRTQDDDGSWFTPKRAIPANNYFDAGFPHGESQYASFNATGWATLGLLETVKGKR